MDQESGFLYFTWLMNEAAQCSLTKQKKKEN